MMSDGTLQISTGVTGQTITATTYLNGVVVQAGISVAEVSGQHGYYVGNLAGTGAANSVNFYIGTTLIASGVIAWNGTLEINNAALLSAIASGGTIGGVQVESFTSDAMAQLSALKITLTNFLGTNFTSFDLVAGGTYSSAMGNAFTASFTGTFPDMTGWSGLLVVTRDGVTANGTVTILNATSTVVEVSISFAGADTVDLPPGDGDAQLWWIGPGGNAPWLPKIECCVLPGLLAP